MQQSLRTVIRSCYRDKRRLLLFVPTGLYMWCQIMWLWPAAVLMDHTRLSRWTVFIKQITESFIIFSWPRFGNCLDNAYSATVLHYSLTSKSGFSMEQEPKISQDNYIRSRSLVNEDQIKSKKRKLCTICLKPWSSVHFIFARLRDYSLITSKMVALHIDFYFVPSFSSLWLIPAGSKTNKWNLLFMKAIYLDKHPLRLWDSWEKYKAMSS